MMVSSMMLVSCVDTIILPDDKTVDEDYWQNKAHVQAMVNAAYAAMASDNIIARLYVWGDFRTDELLGPSENVKVSTTRDALKEMAAVNMQTTNMFADWSDLYAVINRCNIVLDRAEAVMSIDPSYTKGDYEVDRSQMLALRALCYFYLVRNFRDVPYVTEAYMNSSQNTQVAQSSPDYVLDQCIKDLEEAAKTPLSARGYQKNQWQHSGYMTDDAINTLLADIYLWRASVNHSQEDYAQCVAYCDKVIESKKNQHVKTAGETEDSEYPLAKASEMYTKLYIDQNAEESIFELQSRANSALLNYYYMYEKAQGNGGEGWLNATPIFGNTSSVYNTTTFLSNANLFSVSDLRYYAACYLPSTADKSYSVRKMVSTAAVTSKTSTTKREAYTYGAFNTNLNIYRLSDVILMKAEALVQQVDTLAEEAVQTDLLHNAFWLVKAINDRARHQDNKADSIQWNGTASTNRFRTLKKDDFEKVVMQERMREFCFEGRRWYDLMRYNYRHVEGIDYKRTLAEINGSGEALVANYTEMLALATRQRGTEASGVQAKMINEAYLYMPIPNSDIVICPLLKQNPVYSNNTEYEKTY